MGRPPGAIDGEYLTVGTTDRVSTLDPAGAYDNGSFQVENQVYPAEVRCNRCHNANQASVR
ncbi:hypothetical protein E3G47_000659 [Mycobacteroides abscessus]|nr:hypothetical protein [Mycobacteroides abscessus]